MKEQFNSPKGKGRMNKPEKLEGYDEELGNFVFYDVDEMDTYLTELLAPLKEVLDPCCGSKMFWFDKGNPAVLFTDIRKENHILCDGRKLVVCPDEISDFRDMPYSDGQFNLIVFDPPHLKTLGDGSWMKKKYGVLDKQTWKQDLTKGFSECWRVLKGGGTLIFKWNETEIKLKEVLSCFEQKPLFGQTTTINLKTHWIVFYKSGHKY